MSEGGRRTPVLTPLLFALILVPVLSGDSGLLIHDVVYECLTLYSHSVMDDMNGGEDVVGQILAECRLYPEFKSCLEQHAGYEYIDMFLAGLDKSMEFCECVDVAGMVQNAGVTFDSPEERLCWVFKEQATCLELYEGSNPFISHLQEGLDRSKYEFNYNLQCQPQPSTTTSSYATTEQQEPVAITTEEQQEPVAVTTEEPAIGGGEEADNVEEDQVVSVEDAIRADEAGADKVRDELSDKEATTHFSWPTKYPPSEGPGVMVLRCSDRAHPTAGLDCLLWYFNNVHHEKPGWKPCGSVVPGGYGNGCGYWWAKCRRNKKNKHCCISAHCHMQG